LRIKRKGQGLSKPGSVLKEWGLLQGGYFSWAKDCSFASSGLPEPIWAGHPWARFGLAPDGGCRARLSYPSLRWALTPPFHPCPHPALLKTGPLAVSFLWPFPGIAPSGCYPASSPAEPGLSSQGA